MSLLIIVFIIQDDGADFRDEDRKLYQRQGLVSNWSRYEDLPSDEEDIPLQRGEDFNKLLAEAGRLQTN